MNVKRISSNLNKCLLALFKALCEHESSEYVCTTEKQVTTEQLIQFNCSCLIPQVFLGKSTAIFCLDSVVKVQHSHKIPKNFKI